MERAAAAAELANIYVAEAEKIDGQHIQLRSGAMSHGLPAISKVAEAYAGYTNPLNKKFFGLYAAQGSSALPGFRLRH